MNNATEDEWEDVLVSVGDRAEELRGFLKSFSKRFEQGTLKTSPETEERFHAKCDELYHLMDEMKP